jgi:non-ribosomal peptide synthetase-like protein
VSIATLRPDFLLKDPPSSTVCSNEGLSILGDGDVLRWRYGERLEHVLEDACRRHGPRVAVAADGCEVSFAELDARANQMARFLRDRGVRPGDRVAVLLDRGLDAYVTLFGLLKARAAYVPIDANHPADRLAYILEDSQARLAVTHQRFADRFPGPLDLVVLDRARYDLAAFDDSALSEDERSGPAEALAYVLYTSGTTGRPKGVAITHPSICNFVRVAAETYGFEPGDRIYQGMSIAFDFSVEELWVPLAAGATLAPNTSANSLFGEELAEFLESRRINGFCCVPTLLASIERDLPDLRVLLVGGEACPPALVKRWSRPGLSMLNSYGPTEATVTATLGRLTPDAPVTIGRPLPTYSIVILDAERDQALPLGTAGEIGIAGIGVAEGYLNRPELTKAKFIADFLRLPNNPSGRIYRTGDLGRVTPEGEIEYLGRIDRQVKLRGYRIELTEIESVLLEREEIAQVAVALFEPTPGAPELVAYYALKRGVAAPDVQDIVAHLRTRLPAYMIPAYLERLPFMPMLISNKADRAKLPPPKSPPIRFAAHHAEPTTAVERLLAGALTSSLALDRASIDGDFFKDYGAHSLLMARFCARIRQVAPLTQVAMRDIYAHTTIRRLAAALETARPPVETYADSPAAAPRKLAYALTGAAQLAAFLVGGFVMVAAGLASLSYTRAGSGFAATFGRSEIVVWAWFLGLNALAIAAKWALIGRARPTEIRLWSVAYFRFWLARRLVALAPAGLYAGDPLYNLFLRALGARIGARAIILATTFPVAADLLEVGEDAVISRRVVAPGYGVVGQTLTLGAIRVGKGAFVGEASVLDHDVALGDFAQLGHASALLHGQRVPDGKRYHGSPAEETLTNFRLADDLSTGPWRRAWFTACQLGIGVGVLAPLAYAVTTFGMKAALPSSEASFAATALVSLTPALVYASALFVSTLALAFAAVALLPRLLSSMLREGRAYRLYGFHHLVARAASAQAYAPYFQLLLGDSVLIDRFLRLIGVKLAASERTGSNFGAEQSFELPAFCALGAGTVASDGLTMGSLQMSSHAFRIGVSRVGAQSFLGTDVFVPPGARLGDNCLIGTKTMVPLDGPLRENVGLLGSPAFEIPRAATRDLELVGRIDAAERQTRLAAKTRHNLVTMALLLTRTFVVEFVALYSFMVWWELGAGVTAMFGATLALSAFVMAFDVLVERGAYGFRRMKPQVATGYDRAFWEVERYWKLSGASDQGSILAGTPFRPMWLRAMGVKVGLCVFDDGVVISERTLVEIGDGAALNQTVMLQAHSLEEGAFKSDYIRIGAGASLGIGAFVHYGVTLGERARLDADAFLMKGEIAPPDTRWRGNPARLVGRRAVAAYAIAAE